MNEIISELIALQKIDLQLDAIDNTIKQKQEILDQQTARLAQRESDIDDLQEQVSALEQERRTLEMEMNEEMAHVKSRQSKMMQVQTGREQTALLKEIEDGKQGIKEKEEKMVAIMEEVESLTTQITRQQELAQEEATLLQTESDSTRKAIAAIINSKKEHDNARQKQAGAMNVKMFNKYSMLRERRNGVAVVNVLEGVCQGCFMSIPPQQYNTLLRGDKHLDCPVCQRIIYHLPPEKQE